MTSEWFEYEAEGDDYIPPTLWGRDHWSTLAYTEARAVDHKGVISNPHMRCNNRLHRPFAHMVGDGREYPTRLKEGEISGHDDWSCVEDMVAAGLLTAKFRDMEGGFGNGRAMVKLTEKGQSLAAKLRAHKATGGSFADFPYQEEVVNV